jgi:hypothetical protein
MAIQIENPIKDEIPKCILESDLPVIVAFSREKSPAYVKEGEMIVHYLLVKYEGSDQTWHGVGIVNLRDGRFTVLANNMQQFWEKYKNDIIIYDAKVVINKKIYGQIC